MPVTCCDVSGRYSGGEGGELGGRTSGVVCESSSANQGSTLYLVPLFLFRSWHCPWYPALAFPSSSCSFLSRSSDPVLSLLPFNRFSFNYLLYLCLLGRPVGCDENIDFEAPPPRTHCLAPTLPVWVQYVYHLLGPYTRKCFSWMIQGNKLVFLNLSFLCKYRFIPCKLMIHWFVSKLKSSFRQWNSIKLIAYTKSKHHSLKMFDKIRLKIW